VSAELRDQLIDQIEDTHALEQHVLRQLEVLIDTTGDPDLVEHLRHHKDETERHQELLRDRLASYGERPSRVKDAGSIFAAISKGFVDRVRTPNASRNARDGFTTEALEIATYEILERVARRAGDEQTADVARRNRADEEAMAEKIASSWDRVVELSLREQGVPVT
jgi:ferritin-like metal-binding protein YciE